MTSRVQPFHDRHPSRSCFKSCSFTTALNLLLASMTIYWISQILQSPLSKVLSLIFLRASHLLFAIGAYLYQGFHSISYLPIVEKCLLRRRPFLTLLRACSEGDGRQSAGES